MSIVFAVFENINIVQNSKIRKELMWNAFLYFLYRQLLPDTLHIGNILRPKNTSSVYIISLQDIILQISNDFCISGTFVSFHFFRRISISTKNS